MYATKNSLYKYATRSHVRIYFNGHYLSVEDLWDLDMDELNEIYKAHADLYAFIHKEKLPMSKSYGKYLICEIVKDIFIAKMDEHDTNTGDKNDVSDVV